MWSVNIPDTVWAEKCTKDRRCRIMAPQEPGVLLRPGMTIALEPMVLVGTHRTRVLSNQWTVVSADGSLTAHQEHSVAVTEGDPLVLTVP